MSARKQPLLFPAVNRRKVTIEVEFDPTEVGYSPRAAYDYAIRYLELSPVYFPCSFGGKQQIAMSRKDKELETSVDITVERVLE